MNERNRARAGTLVAGALAADGLLHAHWATGGVWPANRETLGRLVLDTDRPSLFRPAIVGPLAGLLFLASSTTFARVHRLGRLGRLVPYSVLQVGTMAVATGLLLRGAQGVWIALRGETGTTFYKLNLAAYTPACLLLSAAAVAAARHSKGGTKWLLAITPAGSKRSMASSGGTPSRTR